MPGASTALWKWWTRQEILSGGRIEDFGRLLDEAWQIKRSLSSAVTTSAVDEAYTLARGAGALGGKLLGAGGI